jgi:hypothetical protein
MCQEVDFNLQTTINGTITFNTENIGPRTDTVPSPPNCPSNSREEEESGGYLIVWVIDNPNTGRAIKFDGLIGDEVIVGSALSARAHSAIPIQAGEALATLAFTDLNFNQKLDFDGNEYKQVTGKIYGSIPYEHTLEDLETSLIVLTLDVRSNQINPVTSAGLTFYNEFEGMLSSAVNFTCWGEFELKDLPGGTNLTTDFGHKGLVISDPAVQNGIPATLLGVVEREEEFVDVVQAEITKILTITVDTKSFGLPAECKYDATVIPPTITCKVVIPKVTLGVTREWSYPLHNDSHGVTTTFEPKPLPSVPPG